MERRLIDNAVSEDLGSILVKNSDEVFSWTNRVARLALGKRLHENLEYA